MKVYEVPPQPENLKLMVELTREEARRMIEESSVWKWSRSWPPETLPIHTQILVKLREILL